MPKTPELGSKRKINGEEFFLIDSFSTKQLAKDFKSKNYANDPCGKVRIIPTKDKNRFMVYEGSTIKKKCQTKTDYD